MSCIVKLYHVKDYVAISTVLKINKSNEKFALVYFASFLIYL